jgi:hypothetical protein
VHGESLVLKAPGSEEANRWMASLLKEDCAVLSCVPVKKGLEEIFLERVGGADGERKGA